MYPRNQGPFPSFVRDHRTQAQPQWTPGTPGGGTTIVPSGPGAYASPSYGPQMSAPSYAPPYMAPAPYAASPYAPPPAFYPQQVYPPVVPGAPTPCAGQGLLNLSLRNLNLGGILDIAAQAFAAFAKLPDAPPAPAAGATFDPQNMVTYQTALAQHAKRDEQFRLVGAVARMLLA
jgi:hypothetical protein